MTMEEARIQNKTSLRQVVEFDDNDNLYKNCIRCGQGQFPFKHGICLRCGENNFTIDFEKSKIVHDQEMLGLIC